MMIRAAAALLLGTLATAAGSENLRGNNKPEENSRTLQAMMDLGLDYNEMVCEELLRDGSVVCSFRMMPPADMTTGRILHDCLPSTTGTNYCLSAEVYRTSFNNIPNNQAGSIAVNPPGQQRPVQQQPIQQQPVQQRPVQQQPVSLPFVGRCPSSPQASGMACARFIPQGAREVSCYYGRTQCNCATNDNPSVTEAWACRMIPDDMASQPVMQQPVQQKPVMQQPVQQRPNPGVTLVTNPGTVTNIDANVNTITSGSSMTAVTNTGKEIDVPVRTGVTLPNILNPPSCPRTKPNDGEACEWGQSCTYYINDKTAAEDCRCDGSYEFKCGPSRQQVISF